MVPNGWEQKSLNEVVFINPRKPAKPMDSRVSFIPMDAVSEDARLLRLEERQYECVEKGFTSFKDNDVLVAKITPCFENGKGAIVSGLKNGIGFGSTEFHVLRAKSNICSKFIYYVTITQEFRIRGEMNMQGSAGQKRVTTDYLKALKVLLPPLPEQKKIAQILSTWDKAITTTEKLLTNSEQQKKALVQQLLTGKKRFSNSKEEWKRIKLKQCIGLLSGNAFKSERFVSFGVPIIRISNIKKDFSVDIENCVYYSEDKVYDKFKVLNGDILIAMSGATTGKVSRYYGNSFCYLNQRVGKFEINPQKINPDFLFQLLKLPYVQNEIVIDAVGGAQPNISNRDIEKIKIHLPSLDEQQKIASVLSCIDYTITTLQKKIAYLKQEKKALMQQLLTGKRRVQV